MKASIYFTDLTKYINPGGFELSYFYIIGIESK